MAQVSQAQVPLSNGFSRNAIPPLSFSFLSPFLYYAVCTIKKTIFFRLFKQIPKKKKHMSVETHIIKSWPSLLVMFQPSIPQFFNSSIQCIFFGNLLDISYIPAGVCMYKVQLHWSGAIYFDVLFLPHFPISRLPV